MVTEVLTIVALIVGPISAVRAQDWIERRRSEGDRRVGVFKALMATRAALLSSQHVQALNMIDLEFHAPRFLAVRQAWSTYFDHLCNPPGTQDDPTFAVWVAKGPDLLARLLVVMGESLGYRFDEVNIKRSIYTPRAHGDDQSQQQQLRVRLLEVLDRLKAATEGGALLVQDRNDAT